MCVCGGGFWLVFFLVVFGLGFFVRLFFTHLYYGFLKPQKRHLINERKISSLEIYAIIKQSNFNEIPNPQKH